MTGRSSLDVFDFGVLLQALAGSGKVGTLKIVSGSREKYISLNEGRVEAIYTPRSRFRIGRILFNMHAVEMDDLREVLEDQQSGRTDGPLGEELVSRGLVTAEDLDAALRYQIIEEILEVFYWRDVTYEFFTGPAEDALKEQEASLTRVGGPHDAGGILLHVTKFLDDMEEFNRITPSMKDVYDLVADPTELLEAEGMPAEIGDLVSLIDGVRDMSEVLRQLRLNRFEAMELFYRLKSENLIRPKNAFELFMLAENRREDLGPDKRVRLYERAAELGMEGFDVAFRSAQAYEEMGKKEKAAERYFEHARRLEEEGNPETAAIRVSKAIELCPDRTDIRALRADLLERQGRPGEAADELHRISVLLRERGELDRAEAALGRALALAPENHDLLVAQADLMGERGDLRRSAATLLSLARSRERHRDLEGALDAARRAVRTRPEALRPRRVISRLLEVAGDAAGAAAAVGGMVSIVVERTREMPARGVRILELLAWRLKRLGAVWHPAMIAIAEGFVDLGDEEDGLATFIACGEARIANGRLAEARETYERASELAPQDLDLAETLALVQARLGAKEHAIARLRGIAGIFWKRGKLERAEKAIREILRLAPFSPDAILEMARLRADQGHKQEAARRFFQLGHLYRTTGDLEAAVTYFDEACRHDPGNPEYVRALAEGLGRTLKTDKSLDTFDALLAMLRARGDHAGVIEVALLILETDPQHREAVRALADSWQSLGRRVKVWAKELGEA